MTNQSEQERVRQMMDNMAAGRETAKGLVYDTVNKTIRPAYHNEDFVHALQMTPEDALVGARIE